MVRSAGRELSELVVQGPALGVGLGEFERAPVRVARLVGSPGAAKQVSAG